MTPLLPKKLLLFSLCIICWSLPVSGQNNRDKLDNLLFAGNESSEAVIRQEMLPAGPLNTAVNMVHLRQNGDFNTTNLSSNGRGLLFSITQTGNQNLIDFAGTGYNSDITLLQNGNLNEMIFSNVTADGVSFTAEQHSNANILKVDGTQSGSLPNLTIRQSGGMQLTISTPTDFLIR